MLFKQAFVALGPWHQVSNLCVNKSAYILRLSANLSFLVLVRYDHPNIIQL